MSKAALMGRFFLLIGVKILPIDVWLPTDYACWWSTLAYSIHSSAKPFL
jgi:hypothetical protein